MKINYFYNFDILLISSELFAENINIQAKNISLDKKRDLSVFKVK